MSRQAPGSVLLVFLLAVTAVEVFSATSGLSFASYYGSHMVLQRGPKRAVVWGYAQTLGDTVRVKMNSQQVATTTVVRHPDGGSGGVWRVKLPATTSVAPVTITATSSDGTATLTDVLFGDVWICSGQSNMVFQMRQIYNSTEEMQNALKFTNIRMMSLRTHASDTSLLDVATINTHWTKPVASSGLKSFSALCLLYAVNLSPVLGYPIGLVETAWGGTRIEPWSSRDALDKCSSYPGVIGRKRANIAATGIWNSMVKPLLNMTIYGAIWYQGESNAGLYDAYSCQFPAMIHDWRLKFHQGSQGETDVMFPFGFVQLGTNRNTSNPVAMAGLRWAQTAQYGYVPNDRLKNVFMAVAMDLPDFHSPYGTIHPRDKEDVADRLALAARAVAYKEAGLSYQGPLPTDYTVQYDQHALSIQFDHGHTALDIRSLNGFQVCCKASESSYCAHWQWTSVKIKAQPRGGVILDISPCHGANHLVSGVRYAWAESPCDFKKCAIYGRGTDLPAPPFTKNGPFPQN